jgi:hypothetical protein
MSAETANERGVVRTFLTNTAVIFGLLLALALYFTTFPAPAEPSYAKVSTAQAPGLRASVRKGGDRRLALSAPVAVAAPRGFLRGVAVGYWTHTWLTGCVSRGKCIMACGGYLNDNRYTVAVNPRWHLGCGQRLRICYRRCVVAVVTDRTASRFDFEFTYALSLATGQPRSNWAGPRTVRWQRVY